MGRTGATILGIFKFSVVWDECKGPCRVYKGVEDTRDELGRTGATIRGGLYFSLVRGCTQEEH